MYLFKDKLSIIVTGDPVEPPEEGATATASYNKWIELDNEAHAAIGLHVDERWI